jgi:hypothetical protein
VAIKIFEETSPDQREALLKEAKQQGQLHVIGIPALHDAFAWRGQVCLIMQWIRGVTLDVLVANELTPSRRPALASAIVAALAGLHRLGYAHRDLKPANILVSPDEGLFLVDFGFAKNVTALDQSKANSILGTPLYMAPELWNPEGPVDSMRADLYSLGKILRQLDLGETWEPLLANLLQENPLNRPAHAGAFRQAWRPLLEADPACDWKALAGKVADETHAANLIQASRNLLFAGRINEAYQLAVECLDVDPDSAEAMQLLDQVPGVSRRKSRLRRIGQACLAAGLVIALTGAFLLGRQSGNRLGPALTTIETSHSLLLVDRERDRARTQKPLRHLPLREFAGSSGLAGHLTVQDASVCDSLWVDGKLINTSQAFAGLSLPVGEHRVTCHCSQTNSNFKPMPIRRETLSLLPFQAKVVALCPASLDGDS